MGTHPIFESDFDCLTEKKRMLKVGRLYRPIWRHVKISDQDGVEIKTNWPRPFGKVDANGLPITTDTWDRGAKVTHGRVSTYAMRSSQRWPKPEYLNPLMRKTPEPLTGEPTKAFRMASADLFPAPNQLEEPKVMYVYRTDEIKEIVLEGETDDLDGEVGNVTGCPLESRFISVTPKDVLILRQFINRDGSLKAQKHTGLSDRQYLVVSEAVQIAQNDGLLPSVRYAYYENRARWRIQVADESREPRDSRGYPNQLEIMNRHNSRVPHGMTRPLFTSGTPWYRAYVPIYSEVLAEETPNGILPEYTQRVSTSPCLESFRPTATPSFNDNNGVRMKRNLRGPYGHKA